MKLPRYVLHLTLAAAAALAVFLLVRARVREGASTAGRNLYKVEVTGGAGSWSDSVKVDVGSPSKYNSLQDAIKKSISELYANAKMLNDQKISADTSRTKIVQELMSKAGYKVKVTLVDTLV